MVLLYFLERERETTRKMTLGSSRWVWQSSYEGEAPPWRRLRARARLPTGSQRRKPPAASAWGCGEEGNSQCKGSSLRGSSPPRTQEPYSLGKWGGAESEWSQIISSLKAKLKISDAGISNWVSGVFKANTLPNEFLECNTYEGAGILVSFVFRTSNYWINNWVMQKSVKE